LTLICNCIFQAQLDAETKDESLNRWKASLGVVPDATGSNRDTSGLNLTVLTLGIDSDTLPPGKTVVLDLTDTARLPGTRESPIVIKEGVEYSVYIKFRVNHEIILGLRYIHVA